MRSQPPSHPRWYTIPVRVVLLTFISTLLCFSLILLLAILGVVILAALHGVHPDMRVAYRHVALPTALLAGGVIFAALVTIEVRDYRQRKALSEIERLS